MTDTLKKINHFISLGVILLTPLFFLPITSEYYEFNKQALLILAAGISLILWVTTFIMEKQVRVTRSPVGLPLITLGLAWILSSFLRTPNRLDALLDPGQTGTVVSLVILFFTVVNSTHTKKQLDAIVTTFLISFALLSFLTVLWASGLIPAVIPTSFLKNPLWTPSGNSFGTLTSLAVVSVFLIVYLAKTRAREGKFRFFLSLTTLILSLVGVSLTSYRLFFQASSAKPVFLSQAVSWSISLEALKSSPLLGTGPATFLSDFTRFRPISYNLSDIWAVRFASGSNYYLQLLATIGLLGLLAYLFLLVKTVRMFTKSFKTAADSPLHALVVAASLAVVVAMVAQLFIPTNLVYQATIFFLLSIVVAAYKHLGSAQVQEANINIVAADNAGVNSPILPWLSLVLSAGLVLPVFYFAGRAYAAEVMFQKALRLANSNDGKGTYETLISTIRLNPYRDTYRITYSQTNLLLANSIASGKTDLTDEQRNTVTQLIQQAIREAKNAVALNPAKVSNLENLATIYRSLIPLAQGADSWTVASYRQAIQLDPVNPNLRIALGGIYYGAKNYDEAIRLFTDAVNLKPNHANAFYNLAAAYREKGDFARAAAAMQTVVNTVDKDSADYSKALEELTELQKKAGEQAATPPQPAETQLSTPQPLPSPKITPIQLPADLGPETTPSPAPTAAPTPAQ